MNLEMKASLFAAGISAAVYYFAEMPTWGLFVAYGVFFNAAHYVLAKQELENLIVNATM